MNTEELKKQLKNASNEETEEQLKRAFKVIKIVERRLGSLEKTDFYADEIVLGSTVALISYLENLKKEDKEKSKKLASMIVRLIDNTVNRE